MHDDFPQTKYSHNLPRAKLFLRARLAWLWGYPLAAQDQTLTWQSLYFPGPWDQQISQIQAADLATAAYNYQRLVHAFPRALPQIVGVVEVWEQRVSLKLQAVRAVLEGKEIQPWQTLLLAEQGQARLLRQVEQFKLRQPQLSVLLDAFAWWLSLDPKALEQAVTWIEQEQVALHRVLDSFPEGIKICALLFILSQDLSAARVTSLLTILADPAWQEGGAFAYNRFMREHHVYFEYFPAQENGARLELPTLTQAVVEVDAWQRWLEQLITLPNKERRRRLDLLLKLLSPAVFRVWQQQSEHSQLFLMEFEDLAKQYRKFGHQVGQLSQYQKSVRKELIKAVQLAWQTFGQKEDWFIDNLPTWLADLSKMSDSFVYQALSVLDTQLQRLPATSRWRQPLILLKVFTHWQLILAAACEYDLNINVLRRFKLVLGWWLNYLQTAASAKALEQRLEPWAALDVYYSSRQRRPSHPRPPLHTLEYVMLTEDGILGREAVFLAELAKLCESAPDKMGDGLSFYYFYLRTFAHWPHGAYFQQFHALNIDPDFVEGRLVKVFDNFLVKDPSPEQFRALLGLWEMLENATDYFQAKQLFEVLVSLKQSAYQGIYDYCLRHKAWSLLQPVTELITLFKPGEQLLPPKQLVSSDFADYPIALRSALTLLAHYHPQAEQVTERILADIKPSTNKLEQELEYLQLKLASCTDDGGLMPLKQRLANLQRRLQQPDTGSKPPSAKRLERLASKLENAALHAFFTVWEQHNFQTLHAQLHRAFTLETIPDEWLADKHKLRSLLGLSTLDPPERRIVSLLCQAQMQQAYPLVTAPANQAWLKKMQAKGLNLKPWVEGLELSSQLSLESKTMPVEMRFANNIFEVFHMGDHFQTCLSRGGVNFFSVVANAADINKRVLYFFDTEGNVLGRCLLAISDQGQLLRFYLYSHLPSEAINTCLQAFMSELVQQMGAQLGLTGTVAKLLAANWYDDGIESSYLDTEGKVFASLMSKLATLTADNIFKVVQDAFAPEVISELGVLHILRWPALIHRFDLKLSLALAGRQHLLLSEYALREIVRMLLLMDTKGKYSEAEKSAAIWTLAQTWLWEGLYEDIQSTGSFNTDEMSLLIEQQPWQALRLFHCSKRRTERRTDVYFRQRMDFYHAKTLIAVHRLRSAQKIINQLAAQGYSEEDLAKLRVT